VSRKSREAHLLESKEVPGWNSGRPGGWTAGSRGRAKLPGLAKSPFSTSEKPNSYQDVTHYNNFYEFGTQKDQPAGMAKDLKTSPWTVSVEGEVAKPRKFSMDEILRWRRSRSGSTGTVAWRRGLSWCPGRAIPSAPCSSWLSQPRKRNTWPSRATTSPGRCCRRAGGHRVPVRRGLRLDEAMHPLALLCVGMYGEELPPQDGAPVRLVVPWKYGFKSIKSIVKIRLVAAQPPTPGTSPTRASTASIRT